MRMIWFLGFLGFLSMPGFIGLYNQDWRQAIWLVWVIWFAYFLPKKVILEKIIKPLIIGETSESRGEKRKSQGIVTTWKV